MTKRKASGKLKSFWHQMGDLEFISHQSVLPINYVQLNQMAWNNMLGLGICFEKKNLILPFFESLRIDYVILVEQVLKANFWGFWMLQSEQVDQSKLFCCKKLITSSDFQLFLTKFHLQILFRVLCFIYEVHSFMFFWILSRVFECLRKPVRRSAEYIITKFDSNFHHFESLLAVFRLD